MATHNISKIFRPSRGVELVFNLNSLYPTAKSSIIHDTDHRKRQIIVAQPLSPVTPHGQYREMHITTLDKKNHSSAVRIGMACKPVRFDNHYRLSSQSKVEVIIVQYELPLIETNIRSAFRMPISEKFFIQASMTYKDKKFISGRDFTIRDVSLAGMGILIPKTNNQTNPPLTGIDVRQQADIVLTLFEKGKTTPSESISAVIECVRKDSRFSDTAMLAGVKFIKLLPKDEDLLHTFLHNAQIDELKRLSGI
ncbi:MAG: hypothetical protein U9P10_09145 [Thermodesulfobacteriota bacterium]|nr:hypothetical protein [Thermodesulfobacteriota bacterium]